MRQSTESTPVYLTIFSDLRDQIVNGTLTPESILPSENDLCARYNASRETIRKGLGQLEQEGLIYSRPRRGYFVCTPQRHEFTLTLPECLRSSEPRLRDIKIIHPDPEIQEALSLSPAHRVIAIFSEDYEDNCLFGVKIKYIPYDKGYPSIEDEINFAVFPEAANAKASSFSYYTQLSIRAVTAPSEVCSILHCSPAEPLLLISGIYISQSGNRIGYYKQYLLSSHGELHGVSGYVQT